MQITIEISDESVPAIEQALARYNVDAAEPIADASAYLAYVIGGAVASYVAQYADPKEAEITSLRKASAQKDAAIADLQEQLRLKDESAKIEGSATLKE